MTTAKRVFLTFFLVLPLFAHAGSKEKDSDVATARAAIEEANISFKKAFERGDSKALASMYTSDALVLPPDSEMIRGNEAIGEFWKTTRDSGVTSVTLTTLEVERSGDIAYEVGTVSLTIKPEGKPTTTTAAKFLVVWKRQAGGTWKLHRDIWNNLPSKK